MADKNIQDLGFRIQQARKMLGLSLRAVADATGNAVSHTAIAQYEKGAMFPSSTNLIALARVLRQPVDFFFRPMRAHLIEPIRFRKKTVLGKQEQEAIRLRAVDFFERYYEIEDIMGEERPFHNPLPEKPVRTPREAGGMARKLREEWGLGVDPLPNLHELMELKGIKVCEVPSKNQAFDGFCSATERGPVVVLAAWLNRNLLRKRATEVHELAHVMARVPGDLEEKEEEKIVWSFAGELLLPEEAFVDAFGKNRHSLSIPELIHIKHLFGASIMSIIFRARSLELIDESLYREFWKHANKHQWRSQGEPGDEGYQGNESHSRFRQLVLRAAVEERITRSKAAALLHTDIDTIRKQVGVIIQE
ncbi:MAG: helix-turn-helix domain-containing protein [Verrucomicrobia bacterium]|nr:helix-turn-helix domain-containing protein [Verrucomicrobiota bacterium]MCH8513394.1 XRE family transcriptional regulator [Kiritimatiellia bacterium]